MTVTPSLEMSSRPTCYTVPPDIIHLVALEVVAHKHAGTTASLQSVSRTAYMVVTPLLYRTVRLDTQASVDRFFAPFADVTDIWSASLPLIGSSRTPSTSSSSTGSAPTSARYSADRAQTFHLDWLVVDYTPIALLRLRNAQPAEIDHAFSFFPRYYTRTITRA
ncbi:hypothetical protein Q5752_006973 [Cryptotrichosporon argae]